MNDYYYKKIVDYIPIEERVILNKQNRYLIGFKKRKKHLPLYMNLCLHSGSTCFRYCVCKFITIEDLTMFYRAFTAKS